MRSKFSGKSKYCNISLCTSCYFFSFFSSKQNWLLVLSFDYFLKQNLREILLSLFSSALFVEVEQRRGAGAAWSCKSSHCCGRWVPTSLESSDHTFLATQFLLCLTILGSISFFPTLMMSKEETLFPWALGVLCLPSSYLALLFKHYLSYKTCSFFTPPSKISDFDVIE